MLFEPVERRAGRFEFGLESLYRGLIHWDLPVDSGGSPGGTVCLPGVCSG
ncbi:hypothetical protein [Nocardia salmonicida]